MTCVVGFLENKTDTVWIGADSFCSTTFHGYERRINKVFKSKDCDKVLIGICGSCRQSDLLEFNPIINKLDVYENKNIDREYMVTKVVPTISDLFYKNKCEYISNSEATGGTFLFGVDNKLYKMQEDYSIEETYNDYMCIGSGSYHADGAMCALRDVELSPVERITKALESAEHHQVNVKRPFVIMNTKTNDVVVIE